MKINDKNLCAFATSATPVDREGWLLKKGIVNKGYQKRWFTLKGNLLFYYEKKGDKEPVGVVILEGCTIELAEDEEQFGFKVVFHGVGNRSYVLGAESQESMEQWMKALACASYDYMKLMVAELQRQLDEMDECAVVSAGQAAAVSAACASPKPPPRTRHNPFNRVSHPGSSEGNYHQPYRSQSVRSAPGRTDVASRVAENVPRSKVTFRELHTAYGRRVLSDFNTWKYNKRAEHKQDLLITL